MQRILNLRALRAPFLLVASILLALLAHRPARGQMALEQSWEFSPYEIRIWVAFAPVAALTPPPEQVIPVLAQRAEVVVGPSWSVQATPCPEALRSQISADVAELQIEDIESADPNVLDSDKLFLVAMDQDRAGYMVKVRELCCRSRTLGPVMTRRLHQRQMLVQQTVDAILEAFAPIARVDEARARAATVRLRAAGLILNQERPAAVAVGDVLQVVVRQNDRYGQPLKGGIQVIPWTFLEVEKSDARSFGCKIHSAMRNPIGGRSSARLQRYALRVRPTGEMTQLHLVSQDQPRRSLAGYEILARDPQLGDAESGPSQQGAREDEQQSVQLVGRTDWRGLVQIPRAESLLRVLYVKHGNHLLARLPIVPGLAEQQTVELRDDDQRLQAEAALAGFRSQLVDLVARRQVLAAQVRLRIESGEFEQARELLGQLRDLDVQVDMQRQLNQHQQRFASTDPRTQARVDRMFADTYKLMDKYLTNRLTATLAQELARAQQGE